MSNKLLLPQGFLDFFHFYFWQESLKYCTYWRQEHFTTIVHQDRKHNVVLLLLQQPPQNLGSYQSGIWDLRLTMFLLTSKYMLSTERKKGNWHTFGRLLHRYELETSFLHYLCVSFYSCNLSQQAVWCFLSPSPVQIQAQKAYAAHKGRASTPPSLTSASFVAFLCAARWLQVECVNRAKDQLLSRDHTPLERPS